eukprot:360519-Chlamydomonas_euryale.AAC.2
METRNDKEGPDPPACSAVQGLARLLAAPFEADASARLAGAVGPFRLPHHAGLTLRLVSPLKNDPFACCVLRPALPRCPVPILGPSGPRCCTIPHTIRFTP